MILLFSLNPEIREKFSRQLRLQFFQIQTFSTLNELKSNSLVYNPTLIIVDEECLSGMDLKPGIKDLFLKSEPCILILTKSNDPEKRISFLQDGAIDCIPYSINPIELLLKIKNIRTLCLKQSSSASTPLSDKEIIFSHIKKGCLQKISVKNLAQEMFMSRSSLQRACLRYFNKSPKTLITEYRIEQALLLIESGTNNVSALAQSVGYSNVNNFIIAFKKHLSRTPKEYIKHQFLMKQSTS